MNSRVMLCFLLFAVMDSSGRVEATEFNSFVPSFVFDGAPPFPTSPLLVGEFSFGPLDGPVVSATLSGETGTNGSSSAPFELFADGILVATCEESGGCFLPGGGEPFSYAFEFEEFGIFSDGSVELTLVQTGEFIARIGTSSLTITTVPEPSALALVLCSLTILLPRKMPFQS